MRPIVLYFAFLLSALPVFAQKNRPELMAAIKDAAIALKENPAKHGIQGFKMPDYQLALTEPGEMLMNATASASTHVIKISPDLVESLKNSPGELAFVIAHEIGHVQDGDCIVRGFQQGLRGVALSRMCESTADYVGLQYLMAAGFDPYDAAGFMGRMLMFSPMQTSIGGILANRFLSDHPVDVDRIRHLKEFSNKVCIERPDICVQYMH